MSEGSIQKIENKKRLILGVGNPLLDIQAPVDQDFLDRNKLKMGNAILVTESQMHMYEELKSLNPLKYIAGGSTLNSIRVCQWILKGQPAYKNSRTNQQWRTAYMGCIGKDKNGEILKKCTENDGVETFFQIDASARTGICGVGIKDKERTLFTDLAAANNFSVSHLEEKQNQKVIEEASIAYISGYFLTVSIESIIKIAERFSSNDKIFCLNVSAGFIPQFFAKNLKTAIPFADFIFMNQEEAKAVAKFLFENEDLELPEIAKRIATMEKKNKKRKRTVVITRSEKSVLVNKGGEIFMSVSVPAVENELIIDVNGAGDAFVGGFISKLTEGEEVLECVKMGNKAAAEIIQKSGVTIEGEFGSKERELK